MNIKEHVLALIDTEMPLESNLANVARILYESIKGVSWAGFYLTGKDNQTLYLHSFQGPLACMKIPFGKGVCGTAAKKKKSILVEDVTKFEGHIACSSLSRSELVVPIFKDDQVVGVIDLDSNNLNQFTLEDQQNLEEVALILSSLF